VDSRQHAPICCIGPPGPLIGLTVKQYSDEFIVTEVSSTCTLPLVKKGDSIFKVREGDSIISIDGSSIESVDDLLGGSEKSREIIIGKRIISNNAAAHSKGKLLWMKEINCGLFRIMDYSEVASKYGEEFLEQLSPPQRKSGKRILAEAFNSLNEFVDAEDED
jgi:hypothetical protein